MTVSGPRRQRGEEGAALLAALIFVLICSVVVGVLLGFADTDFRTTVAVREQRQEAYAADAAVEAAIRHYQQNGKKCPTDATSFTAPGTNEVDAGEITVTCSADGGNAPSSADAPDYSILTRGDATDDGIRAVSGALTPARGGVFVEGRVETASTAKVYVVGGDVTVQGSCAGANIEVASPYASECNSTDPPPSDPVGIAEAPAIPSSAPAEQTAPNCPGGAPLVLQPGKYTDLNDLRDAVTSCSTIHLRPNTDGSTGVFWFDFGNGDWSIGNGETLVGGTLTSSLDTIASQPAGEKCDETQQGVQLIFSGESRMSVGSGGTVELCPPLFSGGTTQRVSIYGPAGGTSAPVTLSGLLPTEAKSTGSPAFAPESGALLDDGIAATATVAEKKSATITVSKFTALSLPVDATPTSVKVTVEHKETATPVAATLAAVVSGGSGGSAASTTISTFTRSASYLSQTFDISSTFNTVAELSGFQVALTATNPNGSGATYTQDLDVVSVSVTYTTPVLGVFTPQSGCVVTGATCPLVSTQQGAAFTSKGTIYAPLAMLDIRLVHEPRQVFGRGIIVRRLDTVFTSASDCNLTTIPDTEEYDLCFAFQLPRDRTLGDNVVFTATVRGRKLLRAYVNFTGSTPVVKQWSSINES